MQAIKLPVTTDGSGNATVTAEMNDPKMPYLLFAVEWVNTDYAAGVDAVLSCTDTPSGVDLTLLTLTDANSDAMYYPRAVEHDNAGAALSTYALPLVYGDLKLVVSSGGATKKGACWVYLLTP